jgi:hypothetical protein
MVRGTAQPILVLGRLSQYRVVILPQEFGTREG